MREKPPSLFIQRLLIETMRDHDVIVVDGMIAMMQCAIATALANGVSPERVHAMVQVCIDDVEANGVRDAEGRIRKDRADEV